MRCKLLFVNIDNNGDDNVDNLCNSLSHILKEPFKPVSVRSASNWYHLEC